MAGEVQVRKGPIEGTSRVLRELLRTTRFKKTVRMIINELDPENAVLLVRTLMWEDPEFFLGLISGSPSIINAFIEGSNEFSKQIASFPTPLLAGFVMGAGNQLDGESLGEALGHLLCIAAKLGDLGVGAQVGSKLREDVLAGLRRAVEEEGSTEGVTDLVMKLLAPLVSSGISRMERNLAEDGSETRKMIEVVAEEMRKTAQENPEFMKGVVAPLVDAWRSSLSAYVTDDRQGGA